jgi:ELWxxDGT repeat protein
VTRSCIHLRPLEERLAPSVNLIEDINRELYGAYDNHPLVTLNGGVLFRPTVYEGGEVWKSDGTPAGTGRAGPRVQFDEYGDGVEFAGARYFLRTNLANFDDELWRTDGTPQGTRRIVVTIAGPHLGYLNYMTVAGNTLFFANGHKLWRSDGTTPGTFPLRNFDINLGLYTPINGKILVASGNSVYLKVPGNHGGELWTSDGTSAGTLRVANLFAAGGWSVTSLLGDVNGSLYFIAATETSGPRLWVTDGTEAGTKLVRDDLTVTARVAVLGGTLVFVASDGTTGNELWVTDGTPTGTTPLKDIYPTGDADPQDLVAQGSYVYFAADDGTTGRELWRTDGTADGTIRLADIIPGPEGPDVESLTPTTGGLYFTAITPTSGKELWVTDGTPEGTVQVADLEPGPGSSFPSWLVSTGDRVFWVSNTTADGSSLWVAGAGTGPTMLSPVPAATSNSTGGGGVTIGNVRYFGASDGDSGKELWRTDGTAAGTWMLKDIVPGPGSSFAFPEIAVDGTFYFTASTPDAGRELWASDGTTDGTRMVKDIEPGIGGSDPFWMTAFQGKLFFRATTNGQGRELWVSDGTADGTQMLKDIYPGALDGFKGGREFIELNGYLYFSARDPVHGRQIWRTDGTESGTTLVTDLPAPWIGLPENGRWWLNRVGDRIVFWGRYGTQNALWSTDGTAGGTVMFDGLTADGVLGGGEFVGDRFLLWARDATHPHALWSTDGTPEGTILVRSAPRSSNLVAAGGLAYFINREYEWDELWRTDGTPAGTFLLRTFTRPVIELTVVGDQLYLLVQNRARGLALLTTDGTTAGTRLVKDLVPVPQEVVDSSIFELGGALFIDVTTTRGNTLWRSDGTAAGTRPIAVGTDTYGGVTVLNGVPIFSHDDGLTGSELWRYDPITTGADHYTLEDGLRLDVPAVSGILANDVDGGGQPLTATLVTKPKNGWLTLRSDGSFFYQPFSRDFSGTDTFTYRADAGGEQSAPVTVSIDVDLVNQAPVPENDTAAGRAGHPVTVRVLANDVDPDNDTLTVASFTQGTSGRVSRLGNALVYTPRVAGALTDTFTYTVRDQRGETATATVTVNLTAQPAPKVTAVRLFPGPGTGSINLTSLGARTLPFQQWKRVEVTFSADVSVAADDLRLIGADGGSYALSGFAYDSARRTASWVINGPAVATWADRLTVLIDGSATAGVTGPGGVPIGDWATTFSMLVGDFDGSGLVTTADRIAVRSRYGAVSGIVRLFADINGDGVVDAVDADQVTANLGGRRV